MIPTRQHRKRPRSLEILCGALIAAMLAPVCLYAEQTDALSPEESRAKFVLHDALKIELVASEPQVFDPVAMCFDAQGNLYVIENRGYPSGNPEGPAGTVAMLQDKDADGFYETRHVFAEGFDFPNGIMPWEGGVLVTDSPHVYYLKDTDGDNSADVHKVFLDGFKRGGSTQLYVSHPTLGPDNGLHFTNGLSGGTVRVPGHPEIPELDIGRNDLRYDPRTHTLETRSGRAQFGLSFDDFGHKFTCSNRNHLVHSVLEPSDLSRNPYLNQSAVVQDIPVHGAASPVFALSSATTTAYAHEGTFTAACGLVIFRGTALPDKYYGNSFVCEPTGNLVHRDVLSRKGGTFQAVRAPGESASEFLATTDDWSRPVFLTNGPDGALYLCDMYRKTIEHPTYLPDEVAAITDFDAGKTLGRIYRITTAPEYRPATFDATTTADLIETLEHPNGWHRDTAQRLLLEQLDQVDPEHLRVASRSASSPKARALSLYLLDAADALNASDIREALGDDAAEIRELGLRLARTVDSLDADVNAAILECANDSDASVRFACALLLGDGILPASEALTALASILKQDIDDPWLQAAVLSALGEGSAAFSEQLLREDLTDTPGWVGFMEGLARVIALSDPPEAIVRFTSRILDLDTNQGETWRMAALNGTLEGIRSNSTFSDNHSSFETLAVITTQHQPDAGTAITEWIERCTRLLNSPAHPQDVKLFAVSILGHTDVETSGETLTRLLTPQATQHLQITAVSALNEYRDDFVTNVYLQPQVWLGFSGETRKIALNGILRTPNGIDLLLTALENDTIGAWSIDTASRARLSRSGTPEQRDRAAAIFSALDTSDPAERFEEYRDVLQLTPQPENGRRMFQEQCMGCHRYGEIGHEVGPDLTGIRSQPLESILLHIINPNWLMLPGYESYIVETKDGDLYTGLIASETPTSITLRQGQGIETTILRDEIVVFETNSLSMMPEELEAGMTRQELRDLLGFLKAE